MPRYRDWEPDGLTRWQRAKNIDRDSVTRESTGVWSVDSSSDWGGSYTVRRQSFYCPKECHEQPCSHRYACTCPDEENPCKHIYRVWMLDKDAYPPPPAVSERAEQAALRRQHVTLLASRLDALLLDATMDVYVASDLLMHLHELSANGSHTVAVEDFESDSSDDRETSDDDDDSDASWNRDSSDDDDESNVSGQREKHRCRRRRLDDSTERGSAGIAGAEKRRANSIPAHEVVRVQGHSPSAGQEALRAKWQVGGEMVTRSRWTCKRRACQGRGRHEPCRHRYRCTCQEGEGPPTAPCRHALRVATLDEDPYPAPPDVQQESHTRREAARAILVSLLKTAERSGRLDALELGLWRAVRYAVTSSSSAPEDALSGLQLTGSEEGSEHRCQGSWVVLGRAQCARLIPASAVVQEGPGWRVQGHAVVRLAAGPCPRPECARLWGPLACSHLFRCDCPDRRNPCKHILRVAADQAAATEQRPVVAEAPEVVLPVAGTAAPPLPQEESVVVRLAPASAVDGPGSSTEAASSGEGPSRKRAAQCYGPAANTRRRKATAQNVAS